MTIFSSDPFDNACPDSACPDSASPVRPLVARLQQELDSASGAGPRQPEGRAGDFSAWYLAAIQVLEQRVATGDGHPPMTRREVELLCRCTISCSDLAEAIACAVDFCSMLTPRAGRLGLRSSNGEAEFEMDSLRRRPSSAACLVDLTGLYSYLQLFGWLIDQPLRPSRVTLGHTDRDAVAAFLPLFDAPVTVDGSSYRFAFDAALLTRPVVRQPRDLTVFMDGFPCRVLGRRADPPLWMQARMLLQASIRQGGRLPEAAAVAQALGVSTTTLRRQLAAAAMGFRQMRERALQSAAEEALLDLRMPVEKVAARLGFSDSAAFRRAFRRWNGIAPSHWRRLTTEAASGDKKNGASDAP